MEKNKDKGLKCYKKKNKIKDLWSNFVSLKLVPFIYTEKEELVSMIGKFLET